MSPWYSRTTQPTRVASHEPRSHRAFRGDRICGFEPRRRRALGPRRARMRDRRADGAVGGAVPLCRAAESDRSAAASFSDGGIFAGGPDAMGVGSYRLAIFHGNRAASMALPGHFSFPGGAGFAKPGGV